MKRRVVGILLAVAALMVLPTSARAEEETGTIIVNLTASVTDGELTLYRVGEQSGEDFRLGQAYGGGMVKGEDALNPELAGYLASSAAGGIRREPDEEGILVFTGLPRGLYLVVQSRACSGLEPIEPFLVTMPCEAQWEILCSPKLRWDNPRTGDSPLFFLGLTGMLLSGVGLLICILDRKKK